LKYSNKYNLPLAFVRAVENDPYTRGDSDFSATGLAEPPRASALKVLFRDELVVDVSSRVASIIGQGTHTIAERAARPNIDICEKRFFSTFSVDGRDYVISGQIDLYETDTCNLMDWKTTKAYAFSSKAGNGQKPEWIEQLNIGAELLRRNGHEPKKLTIIALLKDWNLKDAGSSGMPKSEVVDVDLPLWPSAKVVSHIEERIRLHAKAREILPSCSSKENWGGRRCGQWCDASSVCDQYKNGIKTGIFNKEEQ
jgi:hypothetical protein